MWNSLWLSGFFPANKDLQALGWTSRCSSRCPSRCAIHYGYRAWTFPYVNRRPEHKPPLNKGHNKRVPRRVWPKYVAANAFLVAESPPPPKKAVPAVILGHPGARAGQKPAECRGNGIKKGKNEAKTHGCLIDPENGAPVLGPFRIKKIIFALRFRRFRENRKRKYGSTKHPAAHIYIYTYIYIYIYT